MRVDLFTVTPSPYPLPNGERGTDYENPSPYPLPSRGEGNGLGGDPLFPPP